MSLRDLILGRKRRIREGLDGAPSTGAGLSRAALEPEDSAPQADAPASEPAPAQAEQAAEARTLGPEAGKSRKVVLRRTRSLTVPGNLVLAARRQAVLDRLFIVLDPNEVLISGGDRLARLIVANQRLMVAQFSRGDAPDLTFDFRPGLQSDELALACVRALADFCEAPVNLQIEEQPVTGVFAGFSGLPVAVISFDEAEFRAGLHEMLSHPEHDHAGVQAEGLDEPAAESAPDSIPEPDPAAAVAETAPPKLDPPKLDPLVLTPPAVAVPDPVPVPGKLAAMAFLTGCRAVAEEVSLDSRAGAGELSGLRATDSLGPIPAAEALETWRQAVSPLLGGRLVAVLIPADRIEPMVALALDDRDSVLFSFGKQALGSVSSQALAAVTGD